MDQAQLQTTLVDAIGAANVRKDVTKLPEFHGETSKDNLTASGFIKRVEIAAKAANWTDVQAVYHMRLALVGKAESWFETTADCSEPGWEDNFDRVSTAFIVRFEPAAIGNRSIATIKEMKQGSGDTVADFADRLRKLGMQWRRATPMPAAAVTEDQRAFVRLGMRCHGDYILLTHFVLGLKESIRRLVFRACPSNFQEALDLALDIEAGTENERRNGEEPKGTKISPVGSATAPIMEQSAIRQTRTNARDKDGNPACNYCGIAGHFWKDCRRRLYRAQNQGAQSSQASSQQHKTSNNNGNNFKKSFQKRGGRVAATQDDQNETEGSEQERVATVYQQQQRLNFLGIA